MQFCVMLVASDVAEVHHECLTFANILLQILAPGDAQFWFIRASCAREIRGCNGGSSACSSVNGAGARKDSERVPRMDVTTEVWIIIRGVDEF